MIVRRAVVLASVAVAAVAVAVVPLAHEPSPPTFADPYEEKDWPLSEGHEKAERDDALRRAKVWMAADPSTADFRSNPPDPSGLLTVAPDDVVRCRLLPGPPRATTPKFDCVLPDGEVVKVKYGWMTAEIQAEIAASRLLAALGFGADRMYLIRRLRCYGCPRLPFETARVLDTIGARERAMRLLPEDRFVDFDWVAVERHYRAFEIAMREGDTPKGWAWFELDQINPRVGASRAEVDALRLMAVFLAHWDNKASNQRLVCRSSPSAQDRAARCAEPFALIHDVGSTFGPNRIEVHHWRAARVWADARSCRVSMRTLPYSGGTFPDVQISEEGRALLARQLSALSEHQITALFDTARFNLHRGWALRSTPIATWVEAFREKVTEIRAAGPCPTQPSSQSR